MAENLATGHGLVWNPRARVMVASCPLWVLLLAPVLAIVDKPYSVVVGISITTSVVMATVLVRRVAASPISAVLALVALGACRAVVEWSVSGMENPLAFLLLVVAVAAWRARRPVWLALAGGLVVLVRLDLVLLVGPLVLAGALDATPRQRWKVLAVFVGPVVVWLLFSLVWFGVPLPNPVYAKVQAAVPLADRLAAAFNYGRASWEADPVSIVVLVVGPVVAVALRARGALPVTAGTLVYCGAAAWVGGDYMLGRLLGAPIVLVVGLLATIPSRRVSVALVLAASMLSVGSWSRWRASQVACSEGWNPFGDLGVIDERAHKRAHTGLWVDTRWPGLDRQGRQPQEQSHLVVLTSAGHSGFAAGPGVTVVDLWGIGDPLLARMPPLDRHWRPGHFRRALPPGYLDSLRSGTNQIGDPDLARLWGLLWLVHSGPLWSSERWRAIWTLNLVDTRAWTRGWSDPPPTVVRAAELPATFGMGGLRVDYDEPVNAGILNVMVPDRHTYTVALFKGGRRTGRTHRIVGQRGATTVSAHRIEIEDRTTRGGFDEIRVDGAWQSDQEFQVEAIDVLERPPG